MTRHYLFVELLREFPGVLDMKFEVIMGPEGLSGGLDARSCLPWVGEVVDGVENSRCCTVRDLVPDALFDIERRVDWDDAAVLRVELLEREHLDYVVFEGLQHEYRCVAGPNLEDVPWFNKSDQRIEQRGHVLGSHVRVVQRPHELDEALNRQLSAALETGVTEAKRCVGTLSKMPPIVPWGSSVLIFVPSLPKV